MKLGLLAGAAALGCLVSVPAHATAFLTTTSVTFDGTNIADAPANTAVFNFNGLTNAGVLVPGLSAALTLTLSSIDGGGTTLNFDYSLVNTSSVAGARVSGFGFDVAPDVTGASSTGVFDRADFVPPNNFGGASNAVKVCFHGSGACPAGNVANSVALGATGVGTLALTFGGAQTSITLSNFLDRYPGTFTTKNVNGGNVTAAFGRGTAVPEPATWAMMLLGFGLVGGAMRSAKRRQKLTVTYA